MNQSANYNGDNDLDVKVDRAQDALRALLR